MKRKIQKLGNSLSLSHNVRSSHAVSRPFRNEKARGSNPLTSRPESFRGCRAVFPRLRGEGGHLLPCNASTASYDSASHAMAKFFYVYILQSEIDRENCYTG